MMRIFFTKKGGDTSILTIPGKGPRTRASWLGQDEVLIKYRYLCVYISSESWHYIVCYDDNQSLRVTCNSMLKPR